MKKHNSTARRRISSVCVPSFWRAIIAEFIGTLLIITLTSGTLRLESSEPDTHLRKTTISDTPFPHTDRDQAVHVQRSEDRIILIMQHLYISCANGCILSVMTLCLSAVCQTYFNPALCLAGLLTRRSTMIQGCCFIIAQSAGSVTGAALAYGATTDARSAAHLPDFTPYISSVKLVVVGALSTFLFGLAYFSSVDRGHNWTSSQRAIMIGIAATGAHLFSVCSCHMILASLIHHYIIQ